VEENTESGGPKLDKNGNQVTEFLDKKADDISGESPNDGKDSVKQFEHQFEDLTNERKELTGDSGTNEADDTGQDGQDRLSGTLRQSESLRAWKRK
jgi:hypothetical protein